MRMTIVGRNLRADGSECVIFGHIDRSNHRFVPASAAPPPGAGRAFSAHGGWDVRAMRPGAGLDYASALVGAEGGGRYCRTSGRLALVSHKWSGVLQINDIGRKYTVDLYSPETCLVLMDLVHEIVVDVTALAVSENGVLALPPLPPAAIVAHIVAGEAGFRFLERDADFAPGVMRSTIEAFRPRPGEKLRLQLMSQLLPKMARGGGARPALAPAAEEPARLRDELRMLAAAVDGLALRNAP